MNSTSNLNLVDLYKLYVDGEVEEHMIKFMESIQNVMECEYRRGYENAKKEALNTA